jgi:hypothetical protein
MDETELICLGLIPAFGVRMVVIDFLSTPAITDERNVSSGPLLNGDETARRLAFAKEMIGANLIK